MKRPSLLIAITVVLWLGALPAIAHVTVSPGEAPADGFATLQFQVPHGCEGSSTTSLSVQIPAGVVSVKPQLKPGWEITIEEGTLPEPVEYFGETVTEGVLTVTWSGGVIEDHFMDLFGLSVKFPPGEGDTVYFPAVQTCEVGETAWIQIPGEGQTEEDLEAPAPAVVLTGGASEEEAATDTTSTSPADTAETESGVDPMSSAALVVGGLGLVAGGTALARGRTKS